MARIATDTGSGFEVKPKFGGGSMATPNEGPPSVPVFDPTTGKTSMLPVSGLGANAAAPPGGSSGGGGGGGSGGGGTGGVDPTALASDWYKAFFSGYQLPPDVQQNILNLLTKYASDPATAQTLAQQYLRGTDWFKTTFPGFAEGVSNGLYTDETGYRNYLNAYNNVYNQYLGRHISGDETAALLKEGVNPSILANRFQGQAYVNANRNDIQYLTGNFDTGQLNKDELTALGNEKAGIDTQLGQQLALKVANAAQRMQGVFEGRLARISQTQAGQNSLSDVSA